MTPCDRKILRIMLNTAYRRTELTHERLKTLEQELRTTGPAAKEFWRRDRLVFTHMVIEAIRKNHPVGMIGPTWLNPLYAYVEPGWRLPHPTTKKSISVRREIDKLRAKAR